MKYFFLVLSVLIAPLAGAQQPATPEKKPATQAAAASAQAEAGDPRAKTSAAAPRKAGAVDRVDLDTTTITGNRELPKVLYIVPWKRSDIGDVIGRPVNSLLDEVLAPIDRDVFKRQIAYYQALKPDARGPIEPAGQSVTPAPPQGEK
jgi:hypothetical protein